MDHPDKAYMISIEDFPAYHMDVSVDGLLTIIESSYDGIYITDGEANTILINRSYERISGLNRARMIGCNMLELVEQKLISKSGTIAALECGAPVTIEQTFNTGKRAIITSTPIFDINNRIVMVITNVRDVTELRTLEDKLAGSIKQNQRYAIELKQLRKQTSLARKPVAHDMGMQRILITLNRFAGQDTPILLSGERGTGKRAMAQYIVGRSKRSSEQFAVIDCSTEAKSLESLLFGSSPQGGLFSEGEQEGMLALLSGGTLLLHEVGHLPLPLQYRLLQVIRGDAAPGLNSENQRDFSVRLLCSTSQNMIELVQAGTFREDLYYLLNALPIALPPLRERIDDIAPLAEHFMADINRKNNQRKRLSAEAMMCLQRYDWPGNLRELRSVLEQATLLSVRNTVERENLSICSDIVPAGAASGEEHAPVDLRLKLESLELQYIQQAYHQYGNVRDAAKSLGMDPSTYVRRRKRLAESR